MHLQTIEQKRAWCVKLNGKMVATVVVNAITDDTMGTIGFFYLLKFLF